MNNLKCRKQKMNGSFECKRNHKIINIKECNNCKNKEYATNCHTIKKCTINQKNCAKIDSRNTKMHNDCALKKKSTKISKLERNRKSVFTEDLEHCIICGRKKDNLHEIFFGNKRQKSMKYNFVIPLCFECHSEMHRNYILQDFWHKQGQLYYEKNIGSREEFIEVFGKSYL